MKILGSLLFVLGTLLAVAVIANGDIAAGDFNSAETSLILFGLGLVAWLKKPKS